MNNLKSRRRISRLLIILYALMTANAAWADEAANQLEAQVMDQELAAQMRQDYDEAVQFLRLNAAKFNLDKNRFVAMDDSAGGGNALWLATHDELADPEAEDPVLRESTRLQGAVGSAAQTTVDPADMQAGDILRALDHAMFANGLKIPAAKLKALEIDPETQALIDFCSPVKHLDANDPPVFLNYVGPLDRTDEGVHHPRLGLLFKQRADPVGPRCTLQVRHEPAYPPCEPNAILKLLGLE